MLMVILRTIEIFKHPKFLLNPQFQKTSKMNDDKWCFKVQSKIKHLQSLVGKEKSPSARVFLQNYSGDGEAVIKEGAELNCLDEDFCLKNRIIFRKTIVSATAAGQNKMSLAGETKEEINK